MENAFIKLAFFSTREWCLKNERSRRLNIFFKNTFYVVALLLCVNLSDRIVPNKLLKFGKDFDDTVTAAESVIWLVLMLLPICLCTSPDISISSLFITMPFSSRSCSSSSVEYSSFLCSPESSPPSHCSLFRFTLFRFSRLSVCSLELLYLIRLCSSSKQENIFRDI